MLPATETATAEASAAERGKTTEAHPWAVRNMRKARELARPFGTL
jgi:hypothetical protein